MDQFYQLQRAIRYLADCDGDRAREQNDSGFSKFDSDWGHTLARRPFWTQHMAVKAWELAHKYEGQLARAGIQLPTKPPTEANMPPTPHVNGPSPQPPPANNPKKIVPIKGGFAVQFPYDPSLVIAVKQIPQARFHGDSKSWVFPADKMQSLYEWGKAHDFDLSALEPTIQQQQGEHLAELALIDKALKALPDLDAPLPNGKTLMQHQKEAIPLMVREQRFILGDDMGLGKQQPIDTMVLTPDGWKTIGSLKVGDQVVGSNGDPIPVVGIYPQGIRPSYRIHFSDQSSVECGPDHLWTVWYRPGGRAKKSITLTTQQLINRPTIKNGGRGFQSKKVRFGIPLLSAPIRFANIQHNIPIPAYTLGNMIANGCLTQGAKTVVNAKDADEIEQYLLSDGIHFTRHTYGGATHFNCNYLKTDVEWLGLNVSSVEKFIPSQYLRLTPKERIALLQGLMDGDGSISKTRNKLTYHTTSLKLANDVRELVEGLGGIASIQTYDRTKEKKPIEYRIRLRLPTSIQPFRTQRKATRYVPGIHAHPTRIIKNIEYVRDVESVCIAVDTPNHLYVTEHCILTHNTLTSLIATQAYHKVSGYPILIVAPKSTHGAWREEAASLSIPVEIFSWGKLPLPLETTPYLLIVDEAHRSQAGGKSQRGQAFLDLSLHRNCKVVYALSGTPMRQMRPKNLFPLLQAVKHRLAEDKKHYERYFCLAHATRFTKWDVTGSAHIDELFRLTSDKFLRRTKAQCLNLPPFTRIFREVEVSLEAQKAYNQRFQELRDSYHERLRSGEIKNGGEALVLLSHLAHAASIGKCQGAIEFAEDLLDAGKQVLIFGLYEDTVQTLHTALGGELLTGQTPQLERETAQRRFNAGASKIFVSNLKAGGEGINLQERCSECVILDRPWVYADVNQGESRLNRKGQKEPVISTWLRAFDFDPKRDAFLLQQMEAEKLMEQGQSVHIPTLNDIAAEIAAKLFK